MATFLSVLIVMAAIAALVALVRGVIMFMRTSEQDLLGPGPNLSGERQNKMMRARIMFQAVAVILVILLLLLARG